MAAVTGYEWDGGERRMPSLSPELQELTDALPPLNQKAVRVFWRDIAGYAIANAERLDFIHALYRRLARRLYLILGVLAVVLVGLGVQSLRLQSQSNDTVRQVQTGRHVTLGVTCATLSAVAQSGRIVIEGASTPPPAIQERALERLGFPAFAQRHAAAKVQAKEYVASISRAVDQQIGRKGDGLVKRDGTIDCVKLSELASLGNHALLSSGRRRKH